MRRKLLVIAAVLAALLSLAACGPDNYISAPMQTAFETVSHG